MISKINTAAAVGFFTLMLSACGGGAGSDTSIKTLSEDQKIFEKITIEQGGHYKADSIYLPNVGMPSSSNYFTISSTKLLASPLTFGPQKVISSAIESIASNLPVPSAVGIQRYLVGGKVVKSSAPNYKAIIDYSNGEVINSTLAEDGLTIVSRELRYNYTYTPLTGLVAGSPEDFKKYFNFLFLNTRLINPSLVWPENSGFETFTIKLMDDIYYAYDYVGTTLDTNITPVATNTNLEAVLNSGVASISDGKTYKLTDGVIKLVDGVRVFVASTQRPKTTTSMYRTYFELNGDVYTGSFVPSGTIQGGPVYYDASYQAHFDQQKAMRFNFSAFNGLKNAITF